MASFGTKSIRVLLVDDHRVVRAALSLFIQNHEGMTMVGEAGNHSEAVAIAGREQPDVILLDLDLGVENGLDLFMICSQRPARRA